MYRLYWRPFTASLATMAVLEETGVDYEAVRIADAAAQMHPDYLALNPCGLVPALTLPDGRTMFEAAAIVMHLCDRHDAGALAPPPGDADRPFWYQWLLYLADTPQANFRRHYYPDRFAGDAADVRSRGRAALLADFTIVEDALGGRDWLLGTRFSACDIYLQMLTGWFDPPQALYARFPNIARVAAAVAARPACARAIARHARRTG